MLRLVGKPSTRFDANSIRAKLRRERGFTTRGKIAFIRSLGCTLDCMPTCLLDKSTIILFLMIVKSMKPVLIVFSKIVSFSCIHTDPLYRYYFPLLRYMIVICAMLLLGT